MSAVTSRNALIVLTVSATGLVVFESVCRRHRPTAVYRPSIAIARTNVHMSRAFEWLGYQFARFTNVFQWLKEYAVSCEWFRLSSDQLFAAFGGRRITDKANIPIGRNTLSSYQRLS